eukprot:5999907-Heterocapsa_arctica.AAC.1
MTAATPSPSASGAPDGVDLGGRPDQQDPDGAEHNDGRCEAQELWGGTAAMTSSSATSGRHGRQIVHLEQCAWGARPSDWMFIDGAFRTRKGTRLLAKDAGHYPTGLCLHFADGGFEALEGLNNGHEILLQFSVSNAIAKD